MLDQHVTIGQLIESGIRLSWGESVALTLSLATLCEGREPGDCDGDLLSGVALDVEGTTSAAAGTCPIVSVSALALFLVQLLPAETAPVERRAPAGIYLAIGRALNVVEAPPLGSVGEFAAALARYERGSRSVLLRHVYARCAYRLSGAVGSGAPEAATAVPEGTHKVVKDRRMSGTRVDALRRMIRERDHHDYLVRARRRADAPAGRHAGRANGPSVDALRRSLRDIDRREFERLARRAPARSAMARWPVALALAVATAAGVGIGEWRQSTAASTVTTGGDRAVQADSGVRTTRPPSARDGASAPESVNGASAPDAVRASASPNDRSARRGPLPTARVEVPHTASAARAAREHPRRTSGVEGAARKKQPRRWPQPLRLFASLGRHLSSAFRSNPRAPGAP